MTFIIKFKKYIYLLSISIILNSCFSNCNEINLSKDDKSWIKCYLKVDTLIYTSNYKNVDTFILKEMYNDYTTCSKFELGPDIYNYIGIEYLKNSRSKNDQKHIYLNIEKDFQHSIGNECIKSFQIYDLKASFDSINKKDLKIKWVNFPILSKLKIKSMYFEKGDKFSSETKSIKSFLWSKEFGLLQYELLSGEIFSITERN